MRGRFRILIVDDEDNILRAISRMLEDCSAQDCSVYVDTATNNNEALQRCKGIPYDLVSLDMNMPDFDGHRNRLAGVKLLEKLREIDPALPIIILSGEDELTIKTMLEAKDMGKNFDVFLKNKSSGSELCQKVDTLLNDSNVSILVVGEAEPIPFKRNEIVNLQGVVSKVEPDGGAQVSIMKGEGVSPDLIGRHWLATGSYGPLREEPVDIIGVRDNKFVVISSNDIVFLRDLYRNEILVHQKDFADLTGEVADVNENMKRNGVRVTSADAPGYLTAKKYWQAATDDRKLLPMGAEVDILGEIEKKLRIRESRALIVNENGREVDVIKSSLVGLLGKVITPIDEEDNGSIVIISEKAPEIFGQTSWQAAADNDGVFIPNEKVEVYGTKGKKLLIREYIEAD